MAVTARRRLAGRARVSSKTLQSLDLEQILYP